MRTLDHARREAPGELVATRLGTVHVVVRGRGADVVLVHGVTDHSAAFRPLQDALGDQVRSHAIDLPGHGLSDFPAAPLTMTEMAEWVVAYLDARSIERAVIVGNSLGGGVALSVAIVAPTRVRAVLTLGGIGAPFRMNAGLALLRRTTAARAMPWIARRSWLHRVVLRDSFEVRPSAEAYARYWSAWRIRGRWRVMRDLLRNLDEGEPFEALTRIDAPTIVAHGDRDRMVPLDVGQRIAARIPRAELRVLYGIGHEPQLEAPERVRAIVQSLLDLEGS